MASTNSKTHLIKVRAHAAKELVPLRKQADTKTQLLKLYRRFIKIENHRIKLAHKAGGGGLEIARQRSQLIDLVLNDLFEATSEERFIATPTDKDNYPVALVATGGYGRGTLNPGSDIDLLFLLPDKTKKIPAELVEFVEQILLMLYDVGFKVGHAVRTCNETLQFARKDHHTHTALLDARFITGNQTIYDHFHQAFVKQCVKGHQNAYLSARAADIRARHKKSNHTVYLQEPNVKESCGGLRDYHNIAWVLYMKTRSKKLKKLVEMKVLTQSAVKEAAHAREFLLRVRNSMHYNQRRPNDKLTLRLQGVVAKELGYPQRTILRRIEAFMRDYYIHTRNLYNYCTTVMQIFELEIEEEENIPSKLLGFLTRRHQTIVSFDGFSSKGDGLLYPDRDSIFEEEPHRMMRTFLHLQKRHLKLSPKLRKLFKTHFHLIDRTFRYSKANRETFEEILQHRGDVGRALRCMHRVGFLGRYLPEFGALDCLVQHEFFHQYTADEHTLRCIEELDALAGSDDPKTEFFQALFRQMEDPFILYLALILHDTGRAGNVRHHADASTMLASKVCNRLQIRGNRRRRLLFLVDHHLTFWKTATSKNIDDPSVIAEFASVIRNPDYLKTLFLFTYVDSKGTNAEAWNDWKESLMRRLFHTTCAYFDDQEAFSAKATRPSDELKKRVSSKLPDHFREEIDAHFRTMPDRYFRFRGSTSVIRHIKQFHQFFVRLTKPDTDTIAPILQWEARPGEGYSLLEVCCWDRHLLLAKVAGALASRNINILSADIYTRTDNLVLDIFRVCTTDYKPVTSMRDIKAVEKLVDEEFDITKPFTDFRTLIADSQKDPLFQETSPLFQLPQRAFVSNELSPVHTVLEIQAEDRIGLLFNVFTAIGELDIEIVHARISTQQGAAIDSFYLTDQATGQKIESPARLKQLGAEIRKTLNLEG
jgi:[protein-PII] uridylyltransferase